MVNDFVVVSRTWRVKFWNDSYPKDSGKFNDFSNLVLGINMSGIITTLKKKRQLKTLPDIKKTLILTYSNILIFEIKIKFKKIRYKANQILTTRYQIILIFIKIKNYMQHHSNYS